MMQENEIASAKEANEVNGAASTWWVVWDCLSHKRYSAKSYKRAVAVADFLKVHRAGLETKRHLKYPPMRPSELAMTIMSDRRDRYADRHEQPSKATAP